MFIKRIQNNKGFTLIEALVSMVVLGVIGLIVMELMSRSFMGNNKTQIISQIKQNGQVTLNVLEQVIRSSEQVVCLGQIGPNDPRSSMTLIYDGDYYRFTFVKEVAGTSNGKITKEKLSLTRHNVSSALFCQNESVPEQFTAGPKEILTNDDNKTGVSVKSGSFNVNSQAGFKDVVGITFKLGPPVNAGLGTSEQSNEVEFNSTTQLRDSKAY